MNVRQFALLVVGIAIALAIVRHEPIRRENPFYNPVRESVAGFLGNDTYRAPGVSHELNVVAAGIVLFGTIAGVVILRDPVARRRRKRQAGGTIRG